MIQCEPGETCKFFGSCDNTIFFPNLLVERLVGKLLNLVYLKIQFHGYDSWLMPRNAKSITSLTIRQINHRFGDFALQTHWGFFIPMGIGNPL